MFGMAMKFLELGLEPIMKAAGSTQNQTTSQNSNQNDDREKPKVKSSEVIKLSSQNGLITQNEQQSRINNSDVTLQQLKQSQQKVLEDFKKSIERSIAFSNHQLPRTKIQKPQGEPYDLVEGIVLSKIQELSQEYLQYSVRKQLTTYHMNQKPKAGSLNLDSNSQNNSNKSSSCELIKSIVKSVLLPQSVTLTETSQRLSFQGIHLKQSSVKKSLHNEVHQNHETNTNSLESKNSIKSLQKNQPVNEFIKELFESLGLIEKDQKMSFSLKEMTQNARKKFNSLRGNDYVQKLNEMLKSVEGIDHSRGLFGINSFNGDVSKTGQLKNSSSAPITASYNSPMAPISQTSQSQQQPKKQQRKQILIKRPSDRKVKLISPQTLSQLESKRALIEKQISESLEFLTVARRMRKFSFHSKDINEILLNFSYDFQFMSYKRVQKGFFSEANLLALVKKFCDCTRTSDKQSLQTKQQTQSSMIPLKWNLVNIAKGLKTKNFIRYEQLIQNSKSNKKQPLHEDRCFSLLFRGRTYDFECESTAIRDEYFRAVKIMIRSTSDV